jgi:hypothetical protein
LLLTLALLITAIAVASGSLQAAPAARSSHRAGRPARLASVLPGGVLAPTTQLPGICSVAAPRCQEGCAVPVAASPVPRAVTPARCGAATRPCAELLASHSPAAARLPFCSPQSLRQRLEGLRPPRLRR